MNPESEPGGERGTDAQQASPVQPAVSAAENTPGAGEEQHFFRSEGGQGSMAPSVVSVDGASPAPDALDMRMQHDSQAITWAGPEFVSHEKGGGWYMAFFGIALLVVAVVALVTRDIFSIAVAVVVCIIFVIGAARKPREMHYALDSHGVSAGRSFHSYGDFRGFSFAPEGDFMTLTLLPLKRFMPPMTLYFDPTDENRIMDLLNDHLPLEEHAADPVERLMRRIRF